MPFRLDEHKAKIQFVTAASMPYRIYQACLATGTPSNTRYAQEALCARLSKDLGIPYESLLAELPPSRGNAAVLFGDDRKPTPRRGRQFTTEEVR